MRMLLGLLLVCGGSVSAAGLPALHARLNETTVSGLSSGAFMAVQFHMAHASIVRGAGVIAGGPWWCAQGNASRATGECMQGEPDVGPLQARLEQVAATGRVDPPSALATTRVWMFSGYNDGVVRRGSMQALDAFYARWVPSAQRFLRDDLPAGHAVATTDAGVPCDVTGGDFIADCDYDMAGALLQFLLGRLEPPAAKADGHLIAFDQAEFVDSSTRSAGLASTGYVYVPKTCAQGAECRVHVALHGCKQAQEAVGDAFLRHAGYNRWADTNRLIVLYPQARATWGVPLNPNGCWDWWGYTGAAYATRDGVQIRALRAMVDRLTEKGSTVVAPSRSGAAEPMLIEAGPAAASVGWRPDEGAATVVFERDGESPVTVAAASGSVALHGLRAEMSYRVRWKMLRTDRGIADSGTLDFRTAPQPRECDPWFAHNVAHVTAGRAYVLWGLVYAVGTNQPMGWWNIFTTTALHRVPGGFAVGTCSAP
ncbi:MAG: hypothetical protein KIT73_06225 [Burkholderiales bacterium]|nr:hypothetical protein [Burkholderiales bacterium]